MDVDRKKKKLATADQIRRYMQKMINTSTVPDVRRCTAPTPMPLQKPDANGCNWTVMTLPRMTPVCVEAVKKIVEETKREYDLSA
jgi:hypothetical protein